MFPQGYPLYAAWAVDAENIDGGAVVAWKPAQEEDVEFWVPVVAISGSVMDYPNPDGDARSAYGLIFYAPTITEAETAAKDHLQTFRRLTGPAES